MTHRPPGPQVSAGGEVEGGADAVLDERAGQVAGDGVGGLPAGAVSGDDDLGGELLQSADDVRDDRLEQRAGQVGFTCRANGASWS